MKILIASFLILVFSTGVTKAFNPSAFPNKSFSIKNSNDKRVYCSNFKKLGDMVMNIAMTGNSSRVVYAGEYRRIGSEKLKFIKSFAKSVNKPLDRDYEGEILVKDTFFSYWFPIQKTIWKSFKKSAKKGSEITIFYRHIGCYKSEKDATLVYIGISIAE